MYDSVNAATEYHPIWVDSPRGFHDFRTIEAERFNDFLDQHLPDEVEDWQCDNDGWTFRLPDVDIRIQNDKTGPLRILASSSTMPRKFLDPLRKALRQIPILSHGMFFHPTSFAITLLQLIEEALIHAQPFYDLTRPAVSEPTQGWSTTDSQPPLWPTLLTTNPLGLDLLTVSDRAQHLLGEPIADICSRVAKDIRILHVEPVFRSDLVSRHLRARARIHADLLTLSRAELRKGVPAAAIRSGAAHDTLEGLAAYLARPTVTFHGAPRHVMSSIVRYGFVLPGSSIGKAGPQLRVRCGSSFGRGIYSSPDLMYASAYTQYQHGSTTRISRPADVPGFRIVICAALMGRALHVSRDEAHGVDGLLGEGAHSHISPSKLEYIIFDPAQIIPCYVLHLDYGAEHARGEFERLARDPDVFFQRRKEGKVVRNKWAEKEDGEEDEGPGDVQRKKQALKAAAAKWFPYGMSCSRPHRVSQMEY